MWKYAGDGRGAVKAGVARVRTDRRGSRWSSIPGAVTKARPMKPGVGDIDNGREGRRRCDHHRRFSAPLLGSGAGGWLSSRTIASGWAAADRVVPLGDFTGDGKRDIGRIDATGRFLLHSQVGINGDSTQIGQGWSGLDLLIGTSDFDGDRLPDVLARDTAGNLILYSGNRQGGLAGFRRRRQGLVQHGRRVLRRRFRR